MRVDGGNSSALTARGAYFGVLPRHVYVHVPFCARRCVYCDFSIAVRREVPIDDYAGALARELKLRFPPDEAWSASTLYLGGGTPSRLGAGGLVRVLDLLTRRIGLTDDVELTIEANPDDVSLHAARAWRDAGVNRLSLGAQSFDDRVLRWMHRTHDASQIRRAVDSARDAGIENISLDLIFALPGDLERVWQADLDRALELRPTHLSLYGLTVEPHTPLGRSHERGDVADAPDECYEAEFLTAHDVITSAGFEHYEVSNFALPGRRAKHNSAYWRRVPYAGLGPSAHEFDGARRRWNEAGYVEWTRRLATGIDPVAGSERLGDDEIGSERVYLGLRTSDGLDATPEERRRVLPWLERGWARLSADGRLVLTALGWLRLDALSADLTIERSRYYV